MTPLYWYSFPYFVGVYLFFQVIWLILNEISHNYRMRELKQLADSLRETSTRLHKLISERDRT
jgi:hypothetical protein